MGESPTANEWRTEGRVETKLAEVLRLFELRFGQMPPPRLEVAVNEETDLQRLMQRFEAAATATSAQDFLSSAGL